LRLIVQKAGTAVNLVSDKEQEIIKTIKQNLSNNKADVVLLADAAVLWQADAAGILQKINAKDIKNIDSKYINDTWLATSMRARTIVYSADRVKPQELSNYADLANEKWRGKLCLRTSKKVYNQSLATALIAKHGAKDALNILNGWVKNLATEVFANDNAVVNAIAEGKCDVGIVNSYYYAKLIATNNNLPVNIFMPTNGVFSNVSGVGLVKNAINTKQAQHFINWLLSENGQKLIADANYEFPVNSKAKTRVELSKWGKFNADLTMLNATKDKEIFEQAKSLIKQAKWD